MMKKITLKGIRDSFSSKFALSPSRSTGNLNNVVSTVIADDDDDDIEGSLHLRRNYPLAGSPLAGSPRSGASAASELNLGPRNQGARKSLVQSLRYRLKSRKRLPLNEVKVQAAQSFVPDLDRHHGDDHKNERDHGDEPFDLNTRLNNSVETSLQRADTMRDAHDNFLYSDVSPGGTISTSTNGDHDNGHENALDNGHDNDRQRKQKQHRRRDANGIPTENDDDDSNGANNAIYDLAARVTASQSADSLLSDVKSAAAAGNVFHQELRHYSSNHLQGGQQQEQQYCQSDMKSSSSQASCLSNGPTYPTAERKALPRMGAKTLKLKSPSTSCISRGDSTTLSVAKPRDADSSSSSKEILAITSPDDSMLLLSPTPSSTSGLGEKMKESLTDSGCSIDATPASPVETDVKNVFSSESPKSVSSPHLVQKKSVEAEISDLMNHGWYWGPISRSEADSILKEESEGSFLVRDSSDSSKYLLSLSFKSTDRVLHTRIQHDNGIYFFYHQPRPDGYASIPALIEHSMEDSQTGSVFCYRPVSTKCPSPSTESPTALNRDAGSNDSSPSASSDSGSKQPVRLITPISRDSHVRSLTAICKFEIKQSELTSPVL